MENEKVKYPCIECGKEEKCIKNGGYRHCKLWRPWFHQEWEWIQKIFARDVSDCHDEKGGDDK